MALARASADLGDHFLHVSAGQARQHAAARFEVLENLPGLFGDVVGQLFDVPRAAGRIGDAAEVAFFLADDLNVAGNAARERVRLAERHRERQHANAVRAAKSRTRARNRGAQDVGPRIALGEHAVRRRAGKAARWPRRRPRRTHRPRARPGGGRRAILQWLRIRRRRRPVRPRFSAARLRGAMPPFSQARRYATSVASMHASSWASVAPAL